jgi:putative membrane protein
MIVGKIIINGLAVFGCAYILNGVSVDGIVTALIVAVVLGLINTFIKPLVKLITLPINILTLGLFTFVINAAMVMLTDYFISGFTVLNFGWALLFSLLVSVVSSILESLAK